MNYEPLKLLYIATAFQLIFFGVLFLSMRPVKKHNYSFAAFLFIEFLNLFLIIGHYHYGFIPNNFIYQFLVFLSEYLICPVFYLFVIQISRQKITFTPFHLLLTTPFLIGFAFLFLPEYLWAKYGRVYHYILTANYYGQALFYTIFAWKHYRLFQKEMSHYTSQDFIERLSWMKFIIAIYTTLWSIEFIHNIFNMFYFYIQASINYVIELLFLLFINTFLFLAIRKPIDTNQIPKELLNAADNSFTTKYASSTLSVKRKEEILEMLQNKMNTELFYRIPNITLKILSDELGVQPKHLSQIINEFFHQNFCEYINSLRIEDAKQQLVDSRNQQRTILEIIYNTGFNSKSVFNTVFKKQTGLTPSEYRKKH